MVDSKKQQHNKILGFEQVLWNQLPHISNYQKLGLDKLNTIQKFSNNYSKLVNKFGQDLKQLGTQFYNDMVTKNLKKHSYDEQCTVSLAVGQIRDNLAKLSQSFQETDVMIDLIEPLQQFLQVHQQDTQDCMKQAELLWNQYQLGLNEMYATRTKCFELNEQVEKLEMQVEVQMSTSAQDKTMVEKAQKTSLKGNKVSAQRDIATSNYKNAVSNVNKMLEDLPKYYFPLLERMQQLEEARINFTRNSLSKFVKNVQQTGVRITELQSHTQQISSETDVVLFMTEYKTLDKLPQQISVDEYKISEHLNKKKEAFAAKQVRQELLTTTSSQDGQKIDFVQKVKDIIASIMLNEEGIYLDEEQTAFMLESAKLPEVQLAAHKMFKDISNSIQIKNKESFVLLGWICNAYLDNIAIRKTNEDGIALIESIMHISLLVYRTNYKKRKMYLATEFDSHKIWKNLDMWRFTLQRAIDHKIRERQQKNAENEQKKKQREEPKQSMFSLSKMKSLVGMSTQQKQAPTDLVQRSIQQAAYSRMAVFLQYFVNYRVSFEQSREMLLNFSQIYELEPSRTHILIGDLENLQTKQVYKLTTKDASLILKQRHIKQESYGQYLLQKLVLKFMSEDKDLALFLRLNKKSSVVLRQAVYKQALLVVQPERLPLKRLQIWDNILGLSANQSAYLAFKQKIADNPILIENVEEVIRLDVARSTESMPTVDKTVLLSILNTYAFYNPEIEYCQGMNYIAGFLLQVFKDEELAFKALQALAIKQDFASLFNKDLPILKLYFSSLDRLLAMTDPELTSHLSSENITSSFYSSSWFITLFTNQLKSNTDLETDVVNETLCQVWDYFILSGWKAIFKFNMWMVTSGHDQILAKEFEKIIAHLSEHPKTILKQEGYLPTTVYTLLRQEFKDLPVEFHLKRLKKDFDLIHSVKDKQ